MTLILLICAKLAPEQKVSINSYDEQLEITKGLKDVSAKLPKVNVR